MKRELPPDRLALLRPGERAGIGEALVEDRRARYGGNLIAEHAPKSLAAIAGDTAGDPMLWFLAGTGALFGALGKLADAMILLLAVVPLVAMDFYLHRRTEASLTGLRSALAASARVIRAGRERLVPATELVWVTSSGSAIHHAAADRYVDSSMAVPGRVIDAGAVPSRGGRVSDSLIFSASGLRKVYRTGDTEVQALRGVNLAVPEGEILALLGPSGSGKSTLLNIVGGLDRPTSGTLRYRASDLADLSDRELTRFRRNNVGFIFQFYNLIPSLTAEENVRLVTDIAEHPMAPAEALELVGLGARVDHYPAQLSGGEQQRVAVARAVAKRPGVLLCDEPTGALDSATGIKVLETLAEANRQLGTTVLIITHNVGIAAMADRVLHFLDGRIAREEVNPTPVEPAAITW